MDAGEWRDWKIIGPTALPHQAVVMLKDVEGCLANRMFSVNVRDGTVMSLA